MIVYAQLCQSCSRRMVAPTICVKPKSCHRGDNTCALIRSDNVLAQVASDTFVHSFVSISIEFYVYM